MQAPAHNCDLMSQRFIVDLDRLGQFSLVFSCANFKDKLFHLFYGLLRKRKVKCPRGELDPGVGGVWSFNKVLFFLPDVQTLTLLYTIFDRKDAPFVYLPQKMVPFHIPTERLLLNLSPEFEILRKSRLIAK